MLLTLLSPFPIHFPFEFALFASVLASLRPVTQLPRPQPADHLPETPRNPENNLGLRQPAHGSLIEQAEELAVFAAVGPVDRGRQEGAREGTGVGQTGCRDRSQYLTGIGKDG